MKHLDRLLKNGSGRNSAFFLGADPAARDAVRLMRVPGSVHPLATECLRVKYWIQASEQGKPYSYTLDDLTR